MIKNLLITILLCLGMQAVLHSQSPPPATLEIRFTGIKSDRGVIAIGINRSPEGWPREPHMDFSWEKNELKAGIIIAEIKNLPYGIYAISVLDDVNQNGEMDMTLGIPREGWGFSNNPPFKLSAPDFDECSFLIEQPFTRVTIELRYVGGGR